MNNGTKGCKKAKGDSLGLPISGYFCPDVVRVEARSILLLL